jgi:hypothetical protein
MDSEWKHLLRNLAAMAAGVVEARQSGLALDWLLWSGKTGEPPPRVSRGLPRVLQYGSVHRYTETEAGYRGGDYFEDSMQLALRSPRLVDFRKSQVLGKSEAVIVPTQYQ